MHSTYHRYIRRGWIALLLLLIGIPLISWYIHTDFKGAVGSSYFIFKLIGQFCGIVGMQLFSFSLILSARLKFLEKLFGGLDKLYVIHHRGGVIGFTLLLVHPIVLSFQYVSDSALEMAKFLWPIGNTLPKDFGIAAILLMMSLLTLTFYGALFQYPKLKLAHRFLGLAFFFGFFHALLIPSSLSSDPVLKWSLLTTALLGLIAFSYRTLLGVWLVSRYEYIVDKVMSLGEVTEVTLKPKGKPLYHVPGQFGILSFKNDSVVSREEHPFTLSGRGDDGIVRFSIKKLGDYTKVLPLLTVGTEALVEGPFGEFSYSYGKDKQLWIAGGIGVTPFVSMAESLLKNSSLLYTIDFYYSVRTREDAVYSALFEQLAAKFPTFTFHLIPSTEKGYITSELLTQEIEDLLVRDIFLCGPPPMMEKLSKDLVTSGVKESSLFSERFALLK